MAAEPSVYLIGAGGHARVVKATLEAAGRQVGGVFDDAVTCGAVDGAPILGPVEAHLPLDGPVLLAVGRNEARHRLASRLEGRVTWTHAVHPAAVVHETVEVAPGVVICAGAIVQPGSRLGAHTIVNTGASVDHEAVLGAFVHVAPGAHLAGNVWLGTGVFFGIGACALPGVRVGNGAVVGGGAVVIRDVPDHTVVAGVPARPIRRNSSSW